MPPPFPGMPPIPPPGPPILPAMSMAKDGGSLISMGDLAQSGKGLRPLLDINQPLPGNRGAPLGQQGAFGGSRRSANDDCYVALANLPLELHRYSTLKDFFRPVTLRGNDIVKMVYDPITGNHTSTGFMKCMTPMDSRKILGRDGDHGIRIRLSSKAEFDDAIDGPPSGGSRGPPIERDRPRFVIELKNVPFRARREDVERAMGGRLRPIKVEKAINRDSTPSDRWYAEFSSYQEIDELIRLGLEMEGRNVIVKHSSLAQMDRALTYAEARAKSRERDEDRRRSGERERSRGKRSRSRSRERSGKRAASPKRNRTKSPTVNIKDVCVYITGMPHTIVERDIASVLENCRIAPNGIRLMKEPSGTAYVELLDVRDVEKALKKDGSYMGSQSVSIKPCSLKNMQEAIQKQFRTGFGAEKIEEKNGEKGSKKGPSPSQSEIKPPSQPSQPKKQEPPPQKKNSIQPTLEEQQRALGPPTGTPPIDPSVVLSIGKPGCVVAVHGLPPKISLEELCQFFQGHQILEDSVRMHYNDAGDPTGDCLLAVGTPEDTVRAVSKLNGRILSGHKVTMYILPKPPGF